MVGVVVVSDVRVFRESVARALAQERKYEVLQSSYKPRDTLALIHRRAPKVALVDVGVQQGLSALRLISVNAPRTTPIAVAVEEEEAEIVACAEAGAVACLTREASVSELAEAVENAMRGVLTCSPRVTQILFAHIGRGAATGACGSALTPREIQILDLIERGQSNALIARRLGIEVSTVKNHVHSLLGKLGVRRRGEAAALHRRQPMA